MATVESVAVPAEPAALVAPDTASWVASRRRAASRASVALFALLAALVAMSEIDRLIAGVLTADGRSSPLAGVIGPLAVSARDAWAEWATSPIQGSVGWWILASVWFDGLFVIAYAWIAARLIGRMARPAGRVSARRALAVLIVVEGLEAALLMVGAGSLIVGTGAEWLLGDTGPVAIGVAVLATSKWAAAALVIVLVLRDAAARGFLRRFVARLAQALWLHRLSAVLVVLLFVLTCIPSDGVLDQLPDLQRQWVPLDGDSLRHLLLALFAVGVAVVCALILGRARSRALASPFAVWTVPGTRAHARWWWLPIIAWVVLWLITGLTTGQWDPGWSAVPFLAVPLAVIVSYWIRPDAPWPVEPRTDRPRRARWAWLTGDVIAVSIASIAGLGLVRSFTAPVFSGWDLPRLEAWTYPSSVVLLVAGLGMAVTAPILLRAPVAPDPLLDPERRVDEGTPEPGLRSRHRVALWVFLLGGLVLLAWVAVFPTVAAAFFGAPGLVILLLTAWGAVLGAFTVALQERPPAPLFRLMRLRADPVLTLAITVPLLWAVVAPALRADDPLLHAPRTGPGSSASQTGEGATERAAADDAQPPFEDQLDARLDEIARRGCESRLGGRSFTPALVVVAEGGGIRAAYWTARVLEEFAGDCLGESVLVSSGVSGGSVGLAVTALEERAVADLGRLAQQDAVATGAAALLVGDLVASVTGLRPATVLPEGLEWRDRAALIEEVWIDSVPGLEGEADLTASDRIGLPVLNSTDVRSKCKVLVSNGAATSGTLEATAADDADAPGCDSASTAPAASLPVPASCFEDREWATTAMLSARFPLITPAARIRAETCSAEDLQLVDGGYAEGSGLGTAADLAPVIADSIADRHAREPGEPPIVPILVYLKNSGGYDLRQDLEGVTGEPLVPVVGFAALSKAGTEDVLLQRSANAYGTLGEEGEPAAEAVAAVEEVFPGLAVVVAPSTEPTVVPPLGWALSDFSVASMERALDRQLADGPPGSAPNLRDLLELTER